ncbi:MAG: hypothetical protein WCI27_08275 [Candidatus Omnitrophota bacterium]
MRKILWIFFAGSIFLGLTYLCLIVQNRIPVTHDTFQYFHLQYIYYNELFQHKNLPLWLPYQFHGLPGNYYLFDLLQTLSPIYYLCAFLGIKMNVLYLCYIQIFCNELLFLSGIILLGTIYYRSVKPIWFTSFALIGSTIWYPQLWWNFQSFYFFPLLLYCFHCWLNTRQPKYFLYTSLILLLSILGNPIHICVFSFFILLIYSLATIFIKRQDIRSLIKNFRPKHIVLLTCLLLTSATGLFYFTYGNNNIHYYGPSRTISGAVPFKDFVTFGNQIGFAKIGPMITRTTNNKNVDMNLYCGFILWFFVIIAIIYAREQQSFIILGTGAIIFLFGMDSSVSRLFYYVFPLGNFFRHIGLTAPISKMFLVFYAGFGVAKFFKKDLFHKLKKSWPLVLLFIPFAGIDKNFLLSPVVFWNITSFDKYLLGPFPLILIGFIGLSFLSLYSLPTHRQAKVFFVIIMLLLSFDLWFYRYSHIVTRMPVVNKETVQLFDPYRYTFQEQRYSNILSNKNNTRAITLFPAIQPQTSFNTIYDTTLSFMYIDTPDPEFRADFSEKNIHEFFLYAKQAPQPFRIFHAWAGFDSNKIAIFSRLHVAADNKDLLKTICRQDFLGNMIFTTAAALKNINNTSSRQTISSNDLTDTNDRIPSASVSVKSFSFNEIMLEVFLEEKQGQKAFLYYADAYDPYWKAFVNGKEESVIQANIAYKAVMIPYGHSTVRFVFGTKIHWISIFALLLLISTVTGSSIYLIIKSLRTPPVPRQE